MLRGEDYGMFPQGVISFLTGMCTEVRLKAATLEKIHALGTHWVY